MQTDRPGTSTEEFSVRLSWPKAGAAPAAAPSRPPAMPERKAKQEPPAPGPGPTVRVAPASPKVTPAASPAESPELDEAIPVEAPPAPDPEVLQPPAALTSPRLGGSSSAELVVPGADGSRMGRVFVEAFDRLADRLLERLRSLRQDVDADLAQLRSEVASLRQAVEDVGDRVQLRQLRATLDELRGDVNGLRRAVLEWPELEQVSSDIAAVRGDLSFLFESTDGQSAGPTALLGELQALVTSLGEQTQVSAMGPLLEEVATLRSELTAVRRRLTLRAEPIDAEQLEKIVDAVAARVVEELRGDDGRRSKRR